MLARLLILAALLPASQARAQIAFLGEASIPGDASDLSALPGKTPNGTPNDRLGSIGSAVARTGKGNEYILACDRGPNDGEVPFISRWQTMEIVVTGGATPSVKARLVSTTLLKDEGGKPFNGALAALDRTDPKKTMRFDPEGVRVSPQGTVYISDEYGPYVREFDATGKRVREFAVPKKFLSGNSSVEPKDEMPPKSVSGRLPNRGMEGLAISPDGSKLFGLMQSPSIQDRALDADGKKHGHNCRLLEIDVKSGATREYVYPLEDNGSGNCEILAVNATDFLVLERDGKGGESAKTKMIYRISLEGATDVSAVDSLPHKKLPDAIRAVKKRPLLDLLDPKFGLAGKNFPEKVEGLAFAPDLADGRHVLLVTTDNDYIAEKPTQIWAFAIDPKSLPGYVGQK